MNEYQKNNYIRNETINAISAGSLSRLAELEDIRTGKRQLFVTMFDVYMGAMSRSPTDDSHGETEYGPEVIAWYEKYGNRLMRTQNQ